MSRSSSLPLIAAGGLVAWILLRGSGSEKKTELGDLPPPPDQPPDPNVTPIGPFPIFPKDDPDLPAPPPPMPGPVQPAPPVSNDPIAVYDVLISDVPEQGRLYKVRPGDTIASVAQSAYGSDGASSVQKLTDSRWNWMLYATAPLDNQPSYFHLTLPSGFAGSVQPLAFVPWNEDVRKAMVNGRLPIRGVHFNRDSNSSLEYGFHTSGLYGDMIKPRTHGTLYIPFVEQDFYEPGPLAPIFDAFDQSYMTWAPGEA